MTATMTLDPDIDSAATSPGHEEHHRGHHGRAQECVDDGARSRSAGRHERKDDQQHRNTADQHHQTVTATMTVRLV
ncbi:hypothetical protein V6K52_16320 [Knoellia sp. S7-12]|uniref:hypothetical protein n=1 Tax=Knoellia sp. S7-12 TaxID=3126698 RepID=UPI003366E1B8